MTKRPKKEYAKNIDKFNPNISEESAQELFKEIEDGIFRAAHLAQLLMVVDLHLLESSRYEPAPGRITTAVGEVTWALQEFGDVLSKLCIEAVDASTAARMECGLIRMRD